MQCLMHSKYSVTLCWVKRCTELFSIMLVYFLGKLGWSLVTYNRKPSKQWLVHNKGLFSSPIKEDEWGWTCRLSTLCPSPGFCFVILGAQLPSLNLSYDAGALTIYLSSKMKECRMGPWQKVSWKFQPLLLKSHSLKQTCGPLGSKGGQEKEAGYIILTKSDFVKGIANEYLVSN